MESYKFSLYKDKIKSSGREHSENLGTFAWHKIRLDLALFLS